MKILLLIVLLLWPVTQRGAMSFSGTGQYVSVANADSINFDAATSFSVSFWIYSTSGVTQDVITKQTGTLTDTTRGWRFGISSVAGTGFSADFGNGTNNVRLDSATTAARAGSYWAHIALTWDRSAANKLTMYIDGWSTNKALIVGSCSNGLALKFSGRTDDTTRNYIGYLSDVTIWKGYVLTQADVDVIRGSKVKGISRQIAPTAIVGYWPMDDPTGGVTNDRIGSNLGTPTGPPVAVPDNLSYP